MELQEIWYNFVRASQNENMVLKLSKNKTWNKLMVVHKQYLGTFLKNKTDQDESFVKLSS